MTATTMRAAIYARFSSDQQNPRSCDDQVAFVTPWIEAQGWTVVKTYQDHAISGREIAGRKQWQKLLADAEQTPRPFDVVVCEDLDRWGREFFSHIDSAGRLHRAGVKLADPSRGLIDLSSTAGQIILSIGAATSAEVSRKISEHTKRGLQARMGHVSKPGGKTPYGYVSREHFTGAKDDRGRPIREKVVYEIDPETAPIVRRIFDLRLAGHGAKAIALRLTQEGILNPSKRPAWSPATVRSMLLNPVYRGATQVRRWETYRDAHGRKKMRRLSPSDADVIENTHESIVDAETWRKATAKFQDNSHGGSRRSTNPLTGLLLCSECGGRFALVHRTRYGCIGRHRGSGCSNAFRISRKDAEAAIRDWIHTEDGALKSIQEFVDRLPTPGAELDKQIIEADKTVQVAQRRVENVAAAVARAPKLEAILKQLEIESENLSRAQQHLAELAAIRASLPTSKKVLESLRERSVEEWMRPDRLRDLVASIVVSPDAQFVIHTTVGRVVSLAGAQPSAPHTFTVHDNSSGSPNGYHASSSLGDSVALATVRVA